MIAFPTTCKSLKVKPEATSTFLCEHYICEHFICSQSNCSQHVAPAGNVIRLKRLCCLRLERK